MAEDVRISFPFDLQNRRGACLDELPALDAVISRIDDVDDARRRNGDVLGLAHLPQAAAAGSEAREKFAGGREDLHAVVP